VRRRHNRQYRVQLHPERGTDRCGNRPRITKGTTIACELANDIAVRIKYANLGNSRFCQSLLPPRLTQQVLRRKCRCRTVILAGENRRGGLTAGCHGDPIDRSDRRAQRIPRRQADSAFLLLGPIRPCQARCSLRRSTVLISVIAIARIQFQVRSRHGTADSALLAQHPRSLTKAKTIGSARSQWSVPHFLRPVQPRFDFALSQSLCALESGGPDAVVTRFFHSHPATA
jgi:hypothetical protein